MQYIYFGAIFAASIIFFYYRAPVVFTTQEWRTVTDNTRGYVVPIDDQLYWDDCLFLHRSRI